MKRKFSLYFFYFGLFAFNFLFCLSQKVFSQSINPEKKGPFNEFKNYEFRGFNGVADNPTTWKIKKKSSMRANEINGYEVVMYRDSLINSKPLLFVADIEMLKITNEAHLDFECFWTDIKRGNGRFLNLGPHSGHTSWIFNKEGSLKSPGDMLISADFEKKQITGFRYNLWLNPKDLPGGSLDAYNHISNSIFKFTGSFISGKKTDGFGYAEIISVSGDSPVLNSSIDNLHSETDLITPVDESRVSPGQANLEKSKKHFRFALNLNQLGLDLSVYNRIPCYKHYGNLVLKTRKAFSFESELISFSDPIAFENNSEFELALSAPNDGLLTGEFPGLQIETNMDNTSYIYSHWKGPQNFSSVGKRPLVKEPGIYELSLSKKSGCSLQANILVKGDTTKVRLTEIHRTIGCYGGMDGRIFLNVETGIGPFSYEWSNGATTVNLTGLNAGTYSVTVTADNGRKSILKTKITEPAPLKIKSSVKRVSKFGASDGDAIVIVSGGTIPYCYQWNTNPIQDSNKAKKLKAGLYTVCITDANGCELSHQVEIQEGPQASNFNIESSGQTVISKP